MQRINKHISRFIVPSKKLPFDLSLPLLQETDLTFSMIVWQSGGGSQKRSLIVIQAIAIAAINKRLQFSAEMFAKKLEEFACRSLRFFQTISQQNCSLLQIGR